jgi:hypothetical protein
MSMMRDGKKIYKKDPRISAEFTYSSIMKKVRGEGFAKTGMALTLR